MCVLQSEQEHMDFPVLLPFPHLEDGCWGVTCDGAPCGLLFCGATQCSWELGGVGGKGEEENRRSPMGQRDALTNMGPGVV